MLVKANSPQKKLLPYKVISAELCCVSDILAALTHSHSARTQDCSLGTSASVSFLAVVDINVHLLLFILFIGLNTSLS